MILDGDTRKLDGSTSNAEIAIYPKNTDVIYRRQDDLSATILRKHEVIDGALHDFAKNTVARLSQLEAKVDMLSLMLQLQSAADIRSLTPNCSQVGLGHTNSKKKLALTPLDQPEPTAVRATDDESPEIPSTKKKKSGKTSPEQAIQRRMNLVSVTANPLLNIVNGVACLYAPRLCLIRLICDSGNDYASYCSLKKHLKSNHDGSLMLT
ncbi:hypothetical protein RF11_16141 [Thelohanellus kitauei]|uniref:Uncharacterized protein n=1 Tax=Thelohanellus kitauei TaxID=669202 RepID=A0A0C2IYL5_THEKT|nr:hypothetical protein RF11_16141 [Thelohanellus kitauei]